MTRVRTSTKMAETSTLEDVARLAGVACSTASYVLNNKPKSISSATRERVWSASRELDYRPNMAARTLVTRRTHRIALWVPDVSSPFSSRIIAEIQHQARQSGYGVLISELLPIERQGSPAPASAIVQQPLWDVDGVIAFLSSACRDVAVTLDAIWSAPAVSMGAFPLAGTDFVGIELFCGAQAAVRSLVELGRRRLGYLVPAQADFTGDDRYKAYQAVIAEAGRMPLVIPVTENSRRAAYAAMTDFLKHEEPPDSLFCYNDEAAIGAYRALRTAGLRIPDDVALIGCDGIEDIEYLDCPLSTIVLPVEEMCATAWRFLEQRLLEPTLPPQETIYSGHLALRQSAPPSG